MEHVQDKFPRNVNWSFLEGKVEIEAPIAILDVMKGLRTVNDSGKSAKSVFRCLGYDDKSDTSLLYASPITG